MRVYVGRPFRRKGFHTVLDAWQKMGGEKTRMCCSSLVVRVPTSPRRPDVSCRPSSALGYVRDIRTCYAACDVSPCSAELA